MPWALATGIAGLVANVLLVLFFLLAEPFGVSGPLAGDARRDYSWLGPANDLVIVVQFLTFIPVALALRRWLPRTRPVRAATAAAVGAMITVAILQLLLVVGALDFDVQVVLVVVAFLPVYGWVLTVSSTGHRHGTLPRPVTRFGLLLGASYPVGLIIAMAGLIFSWGSATQFAYLLPGVDHRGRWLVGSPGLAAARGPTGVHQAFIVDPQRERNEMRIAYKLLAYLVAAEVAIQAMVMVWAVAGLGKWVDEGGTFDKAVMESAAMPFPEIAGIIVHGINGTFVVPGIALLLLIVSFFLHVRGAIKWAVDPVRPRGRAGPDRLPRPRDPGGRRAARPERPGPLRSGSLHRTAHAHRAAERCCANHRRAGRGAGGGDWRRAGRDVPLRTGRTGAVVWGLVGSFGVPTIPVAVHPAGQGAGSYKGDRGAAGVRDRYRQ